MTVPKPRNGPPRLGRIGADASVPRAGRSCRHLLLVDEAEEDGLEVERLFRVGDERQAGVDREQRDRTLDVVRMRPPG